MFSVRFSLAVMAVVATLLISACGGPAAALPTQAIAPQPTAHGSAAATGHVGDTLKFQEFGSNSEIDATLVKVFDPAVPTDSSTSALPSGARWVGVELSITNNDSDIGGQSSNVDAAASDGTQLTTDQVYQGFSRPIGDFQGCTADTEEDAQQGVPYTRCAAFVVPNGATLTQVGLKVGGAEIFSSLVPSDQATWSVP